MSDLRDVLGVPDLDEALLEHALTHRSFAYENGQIPNNERLEFLGDRVLGLAIAELLSEAYPTASEGELVSKRYSAGSSSASNFSNPPSAWLILCFTCKGLTT